MMIRKTPEDEKRMDECHEWMIFNGEQFVFKENTPKDIIEDYERIKAKYKWFEY